MQILKATEYRDPDQEPALRTALPDEAVRQMHLISSRFADITAAPPVVSGMERIAL
jgi:hypothetical protein